MHGQNASARAASIPRARIREVAVGDVLRGRYRIQEVLGHGGMGTVFGAEDEYRLDLPDTGRRLAVKVPHTAVTLREDLLAEIQREFQHLQLLSHPNIVRVHEFDRDGDIVFFTMEALDGLLLGRVLDSRNAIALPRPHALSIIRDVGAALSHAHSRGVVHGDVNPRNIFLTNDGEVRVLDFGASHPVLDDAGTVDGVPGLRMAMATRGYASCQVLEGHRPDARDDVFAFACLMYVLLSGAHPFPNRTAVEACAQRWKPSRPGRLTGRQWRVLREGLRWEREQRPRDVQGWLNRFDLEGASPHLPALGALLKAPVRRRSGAMLVAAGAIGLALLLAVGYWGFTDGDSLMADAAAWSAKARSALSGTTGLNPPAVDNSPAVPAPSTDAMPPSRPAIPPAAGLMPPTVRPRPGAPSPAQNAASAPPSPPTPTPAPARAPGSASMLSHPAASAPQPAVSARTPAATTPAARNPGAATPAIGDAAIRNGAAGAARIEMAADTVDVLPADRMAHVVVRRRGTTRGTTDFTWWTESGTAKPGVDFAPATPRVEHFDDGSNSVTLNIPVSDLPRSQPKSFYAVIDRTESGAALGTRTLTMVTILPPD